MAVVKPNAIEVSGLFAHYGDSPVLQDISFALPAGAAAALIGPNGAGKSTLLRCLAGRMTPRAGRILIAGQDIARMPDRLRARRLGVVTQHSELPIAFSVAEVVALGRGPHAEGWSRRDPRGAAAVERAMVLTDVIDLRQRDARTLSGGERQRVMLAMALAQEPEMLLLDEATAHLDINHRQELMQIVERLNRDSGLTLLMVSHDLDLAAACCERVLLLECGRIVADGPPASVLSSVRLSETYGCEISVQHLADGSLHVAPALQGVALAHRGDSLQVHLIGGGGTAETPLRRLRLAGYRLTAGVLNHQDSDADVARALDIPCALEAPFAPIGDAALAEAESFVRQACAVVLTSAPFGPGNLRNLDLAELALRLGKTVLLAEGVAERDFTPGKQAAARVQTLLDDGARPYVGLQALLDALPRCDWHPVNARATPRADGD